MIGLITDEGIEVLIHIGIDTVELGGTPFVAHVAAMDAVHKGDLLMDADLAAIEAAGKPTVTIVAVTNTDDYEKVEGHVGCEVQPGDPLIEVS